MKICVIDCGTEWLEDIKNNLMPLGCEVQVFSLQDLGKAKFDIFSGIVISGAPTLLTQVDQTKYLEPFKFILDTEIPILGICLGHQIIGLLHGARIDSDTMINKMEHIEILEKNDLFLGIENNALFREEHSEFISLPDQFELLGKSESCDNEVMRHKDKKIWSMQFHPEVSGENGKMLFSNFMRLCLS